MLRKRACVASASVRSRTAATPDSRCGPLAISPSSRIIIQVAAASSTRSVTSTARKTVKLLLVFTVGSDLPSANMIYPCGIAAKVAIVSGLFVYCIVFCLNKLGPRSGSAIYQMTENDNLNKDIYRKVSPRVDLPALEEGILDSVSYTHLTLPTIYSV